MKTRLVSLAFLLFCSAYSFAQLHKTVKSNYQPQVSEKKMPPKAEPVKQNTPPLPKDLQKAVINIVVGDDGKDKDTYLHILVNDGNKRIACYFGQKINGVIHQAGGGEYFSGDNETLATNLEASVPTGEMKQVGSLPLPVLREAQLSDFTNNNGGSLVLSIFPNGHDTWKIKSLSITMYFNNDSGTPHKVTWNGFTVSQDSRIKTLEFDKDFNPIQ